MHFAFLKWNLKRLIFKQYNSRTGGPNVTYPWMCSLKTSGYRGRHRCGVTLLSGHWSVFLPPSLLSCAGKPSASSPHYKDHQDAPTIFVGAAHCNYICKDKSNPDSPGLEVCCCRKSKVATSCARDSLVSLTLYFQK